MRRPLLKAVAVVGALALVTCAAAYGLKADGKGVSISVTAGIAPRELPAHGNAPVEVSSVTRVKSTNGLPAPALTQLTIAFDKHGSVYTKGLPVCTAAKLANTTPETARKRCREAIVGEGTGAAEVNLPGKAPMTIRSPLTLFNAPPVGGRPSLIAHAYETVPAPKTLLVSFPIERVSLGRYGYRVKIQIPPIAEGFGSATLAEATVGKTWKHGGKTVGYTNGHCAGGRLQVYGTLRLADGSFFPATLTSPCHVPG